MGIVKKVNPRTGRKTAYLGHAVRDVNEPGLDSISEVRGIARKILENYKKRKISYNYAVKQASLLKLVVMRDPDFRGLNRRKAIRIADRVREQLKRLKKR